MTFVFLSVKNYRKISAAVFLLVVLYTCLSGDFALRIQVIGRQKGAEICKFFHIMFPSHRSHCRSFNTTKFLA